MIAAQNGNKSISYYKTWQICISNVVYCSLADVPVCVDNIKKHTDATDSSRVGVWPRLRDFNIAGQCADDVCALITCFTSQALSCHL